MEHEKATVTITVTKIKELPIILRWIQDRGKSFLGKDYTIFSLHDLPQIELGKFSVAIRTFASLSNCKHDAIIKRHTHVKSLSLLMQACKSKVGINITNGNDYSIVINEEDVTMLFEIWRREVFTANKNDI